MPNPLNCLHKVKSQCTEFLAITASTVKITSAVSSSNSAKQEPPSRWKPPQEGCVKINSDCAFDVSTGKGFSGIICRNNQGRILTASSTKFYASSPLVAEAISLRDAASLAVNLQLENALFESDNQILIDVCNKNKVRLDIQGIAADIENLTSSLNFRGFTWTKREGNECAHTIATLAKEDQLQGLWTIRPPPRLRRAIVKDAQALWK